jgi:hypothetical protein
VQYPEHPFEAQAVQPSGLRVRLSQGRTAPRNEASAWRLGRETSEDKKTVKHLIGPFSSQKVEAKLLAQPRAFFCARAYLSGAGQPLKKSWEESRIKTKST